MPNYKAIALKSLASNEDRVSYKEFSKLFSLTLADVSPVIAALERTRTLRHVGDLVYCAGPQDKRILHTEEVLEAIRANGNVMAWGALKEATDISWGKLGHALWELRVTNVVEQGPDWVYSIVGEEQVPEGARLKLLGIERTLPTSVFAVGHCPFVFKHMLDKHCPDELDAIMEMDDGTGFPTPVLRLESPCKRCLDKRVREK